MAIIVDIKESVSSGLSLSEALSGYTRYFSPAYVNLVRAGESGGNLDSILEELADLGEKQEAIKGKVMAAMADIKGVTVEGSTPLFDVTRMEIKGAPIISVVEKRSGDMFAIRVQKLEENPHG